MITGKNTGVIKNVQSELTTITPKLNLNPPFSWPSNKPRNKKVK
jgi:hypothetical protein